MTNAAVPQYILIFTEIFTLLVQRLLNVGFINDGNKDIITFTLPLLQLLQDIK